MKYPEEMYIDSQIFAEDMDGSESNLTEKIVKIRASVWTPIFYVIVRDIASWPTVSSSREIE